MTTSRRSQQTLFAESTPSLADSPASPSPSRARGAATRTRGGSGPKCSASSENSDPVGSSLRTYLASALSALTRSSRIWSKRATPLGRSWWVLTTSERPTDASASSSWPTASARHWKDTPGMARESTNADGSTRNRVDQLPRAVFAARSSWPTPTAGDADASGNRNLAGSKAHAGTSLTDAVLSGQRPRGPLDPASPSTDGSRPGSSMWPTPASESADGGTKGLDGGAGARSMLPPSFGKGWRAKLNPDWVSCLMGFPTDWLHGIDVPVSRPSATRSSRKPPKRSGRRSTR